MSQLVYIVKRGKNTGAQLRPHWFTDAGGYFQAHKTNSRNDPEDAVFEQKTISSSSCVWATTFA